VKLEGVILYAPYRTHDDMASLTAPHTRYRSAPYRCGTKATWAKAKCTLWQKSRY